jgi:hypothetical protein
MDNNDTSETTQQQLPEKNLGTTKSIDIAGGDDQNTKWLIIIHLIEILLTKMGGLAIIAIGLCIIIFQASAPLSYTIKFMSLSVNIQNGTVGTLILFIGFIVMIIPTSRKTTNNTSNRHTTCTKN